MAEGRKPGDRLVDHRVDQYAGLSRSPAQLFGALRARARWVQGGERRECLLRQLPGALRPRMVRVEHAGQTEGCTRPLGVARREGLVRARERRGPRPHPPRGEQREPLVVHGMAISLRGPRLKDLDSSLLIAQTLRRTPEPSQIFAELRETGSVVGMVHTCALLEHGERAAMKLQCLVEVTGFA